VPFQTERGRRRAKQYLLRSREAVREVGQQFADDLATQPVDAYDASDRERG
jgi:hypothetical protein